MGRREDQAEPRDDRREIGRCGRAAPPIGYRRRARAVRLEARIDGQERDLSAEQKALRNFEFAKPYIDAYLPASPFQTLALITGLLLLGTIVKGVFLIANNVLVARLAQLATFDLRKLFYRRTLQMDLATFSEDGTADLMSRFTNDMNIVAAGLESLFGRLVRRAA